jgi:competence protein ComEC
VLELLNPPADTSGLSPNDASLAFVLRLAGVPRALFLGDLGVGVEPDLAVPPLDVLMVGHHGSRHSTSEGLLKAASPGLAVISVGRNGYGHPTAEVLERLAAHGVEVMTTREHGAIRVDLSGEPSWTPSVVPAAPP